MLENKINAKSSAELAREEERISKQKAIALFEQNMLGYKKRVRWTHSCLSIKLFLRIFIILPDKYAP